MTRRTFLHKVMRATRWTLLSALLPTGVGCSAAKSTDTDPRHLMSRLQGLSLEEIARRKLHHGRDRFLNPFSDASPGGFSRVLKWKLFSKNHFKHLYPRETVQPVTFDWTPVRSLRGVSVTFVNHASVLIKDVDHYLLVDPIFFGINRWIDDYSPLKHSLEGFPKPDQILITHGHYDHLDRRTLKYLGPDPHLIAPLGHDAPLGDIQPRRSSLDWFQTIPQGARRITLLPAHHWTMRNPLVGPNRSLWGAFMIKTAGGPTIFVSGDTAYSERFKEIGAAYDIDLAILSVGAYEPRWMMVHSHMNPAETVQAFKDLGARRLLPVHWGTFRLGDEPVYLPPDQLREALQREQLGDRLVAPKHGQTHILEG